MGPVVDWRSVWHEVEPQIELALRRSPPGADLFDVLAMLELEHAQLWRHGRTVVVTRIEGDVFWVWLAEGTQADLRELLAMGEVWAKAQGCAKIGLWGRRGWQKMLCSAGFRTGFVYLEKELWVEKTR